MLQYFGLVLMTSTLEPFSYQKLVVDVGHVGEEDLQLEHY